MLRQCSVDAGKKARLALGDFVEVTLNCQVMRVECAGTGKQPAARPQRRTASERSSIAACASDIVSAAPYRQWAPGLGNIITGSRKRK